MHLSCGQFCTSLPAALFLFAPHLLLLPSHHQFIPRQAPPGSCLNSLKTAPVGAEKLLLFVRCFTTTKSEEAVAAGSSPLPLPSLSSHTTLPAPASCLSWGELMQGRAGVFLIPVADFSGPFITVTVADPPSPSSPSPSASQPAFLKINRSAAAFGFCLWNSQALLVSCPVHLSPG